MDGGSERGGYSVTLPMSEGSVATVQGDNFCFNCNNGDGFFGGEKYRADRKIGGNFSGKLGEGGQLLVTGNEARYWDEGEGGWMEFRDGAEKKPLLIKRLVVGDPDSVVKLAVQDLKAFNGGRNPVCWREIEVGLVSNGKDGGKIRLMVGKLVSVR